MSVTTYKWTIDRWHKIVESGALDNQNVELLEGEIVHMSPEGIPHSSTNSEIGDYLQDLLRNKAFIRISHPITLDNSEPEPDIAILRLPKTIYRKHHPYPEDIHFLIEISNSTLQLDLTNKATIYAKNNIQEYWVVDLKNNKLIVHTLPKDNSYQQISEYNSGKIVTTSFPNIDIELSNILLYKS